MKTLRFAVVLTYLLGMFSVTAGYVMSISSAGTNSIAVNPGQTVTLDVSLSATNAAIHNSAIFRLVSSATGLRYESYRWQPPYQNQTATDDSKPSMAALPSPLLASTLQGNGYSADTVDLELSNVLSDDGSFTDGALVRAVFLVPSDYQGPSTIKLSVVPVAIADGFDLIPTTGAEPFTIYVATKISPIPDQTIPVNGPISPIPFIIHGGATPPSNLLITGSSSNKSLIPDENIAFGGSGANRTITVTPAANQKGSTTIRVTLTEGELVTTAAFVVTVSGTQIKPTISPISDLTINEDTVATVAFTVTQDRSKPFILTAVSSNPALVPASSIIFGGTGTNRTATLTPLPRAFGLAVITFTVSDGSLASSQSFTLTVSHANQPPTLSGLSDKVVLPGTLVFVSYRVFDVDNAPGEVVVSATSSDQNIVQDGNILLSGSTTNRVIAISQKSLNAQGSTVITVTAKDPAGASAVARFKVTFSSGTLNPPRLEIRKIEATGSIFVGLTGDANRTFTVESSTNLQTWVFLTTIPTDGTGRGSTTDSSTGRLRFYRTR